MTYLVGDPVLVDWDGTRDVCVPLRARVTRVSHHGLVVDVKLSGSGRNIRDIAVVLCHRVSVVDLLAELA